MPSLQVALAFGNRVAKADDPVVSGATDASALPQNLMLSIWGPRVIGSGFSVLGRGGETARK